MCEVPWGKSLNLLQVTARLLTPQKQSTFFFESNIKKTLSEQTKVLDTLQIPKLSYDLSLLCEVELTESELHDALKKLRNNKSPGNKGLAMEFYLSFWDDIKDIYIFYTDHCY